MTVSHTRNNACIERMGVEFVLPRELMNYVQADDLGLEVDAIMTHMLDVDAHW